MTGTTQFDTRRHFIRGVLASAPFILVLLPFGMLFGVVATEAGLNLPEVMGFALAVFAGAAQFSALQLMQDEAPTLVILATSLAVNLRMSMYSAALTPALGKLSLGKRAIAAFFIVDQTYASATLEFEKNPELTPRQKLAFFFGSVIPVAPIWYIATWIGAVIGNQIPTEWPVDFAMPVTFIAMVGPMLRTLPHVVAAVTGLVMSLLLIGLPFSSGVLVAGILAMLAGAMTELWQERRA